MKKPIIKIEVGDVILGRATDLGVLTRYTVLGVRKEGNYFYLNTRQEHNGEVKEYRYHRMSGLLDVE